MDSERECLVLEESVEDNEEIVNDSGESKVQNNGSHVVENNDNNEFFPELGHSGAEATSPSVNLEPVGVSPISASVKKGHGLRKWRRIRRDSNREGYTSIDADRLSVQDLRDSGAKPSKRMQYADIKGEGSVSSTNAHMDDFPLRDDSGVGSPFVAGTDSENSSKSSTAASAPRMKNEIPMFMSGKNVANTKKASGERVKIKKANSHSSMESDSRSSNFVFKHPVNNGVSHGYDEEDSDAVIGSRQQIAGSSSKVKEENCGSHCSITEQDLLYESMSALHAAQEALGKEVSKFKEIGISVSVDDSITDLYTEISDEQQNQASHSEVVETTNGDVITELENLFKQKVEAEVEYLVVSTRVQTMRDAAIETQLLDKLREAEKKADNFCQDIDKIVLLEKRVRQYRSCFLMQLVLFVVILAILASRFSPSRMEIVPT